MRSSTRTFVILQSIELKLTIHFGTFDYLICMLSRKKTTCLTYTYFYWRNAVHVYVTSQVYQKKEPYLSTKKSCK